MKMTGIVAVCVAAFVGGARLALAAFAPVLPPDFDRKWDQDFAEAYWTARYYSGEQVEYYLSHGRWATDAEEMLLGGAHADINARWRETNAPGWRRHVEDLRREIEFVSVDGDRSVVTYRPLRIEDRRIVGVSEAVRCTVTLDAEYARAWGDWFANPGARASSALPPAIDPWSRTDCRRGTGIRAWLSWAGLDRVREPPPERYSALTYAERAWDRAGVHGGSDPQASSRREPVERSGR